MTPTATFFVNYPKLAVWIVKNIPKAATKPKVLTAFMKYSEQGAFLTWISLTPGTSPFISFRAMPGANGEFDGDVSPNTVYLAKEICEKFENSPTDAADPRMHLLLESTILHEMVHWGDWKDGVDQPPEEGKEFEKEAYGADVDRYW
jgi:hypothetical protein